MPQTIVGNKSKKLLNFNIQLIVRVTLNTTVSTILMNKYKIISIKKI